MSAKVCCRNMGVGHRHNDSSDKSLVDFNLHQLVNTCTFCSKQSSCACVSPNLIILVSTVYLPSERVARTLSMYGSLRPEGRFLKVMLPSEPKCNSNIYY